MITQPGTSAIQFTSGNIFMSNCEALVCPVNTKGTLGAGLALTFRKKFPQCAEFYYEACRKGLDPGGVVAAPTKGLKPRYVFYVATKRDWLKPSEIEDIELAAQNLRRTCASLDILSLAVPALGCEPGGLSWKDVKPVLATLLGVAPRVLVYEPGGG